MNWRNIANELKGWKSLEDIIKTLKIKKSTAYVYLHKLDKMGFVLQKVKRPRGTMYLISPLPKSAEHYGVYEGTEFVTTEMEFTKKEITPEQKIAFFLNKFKEKKNTRHYNQAMRLIRGIKNWKRLYRYLKAYNVKEEFKKLYLESRKNIKKIPKMPKRYQRLLGV